MRPNAAAVSWETLTVTAATSFVTCTSLVDNTLPAIFPFDFENSSGSICNSCCMNRLLHWYVLVSGCLVV